ncbi:MAG: F0F1 ATP synthase subunit alpha, partial [Burkholderiales bacterium]|nr:F0F1 ATP synthase subunit alpha [Burkholderiales bacterium]
SPMSISEMALTLFAVNKGFLDDVEVKKALAFESALKAFMRDKHADLMGKIESDKDMKGDTEKQLSDAIAAFKESAVY